MAHPVAIITNSAPPYRIAFLERLIRECPEFEIHSVFTHDQGSSAWASDGLDRINAVLFGGGDSAETKSAPRYVLREISRAGRVIRWLRDHAIEAVVIGGYDDPGYLRVMRWCHRAGVPCFLLADSNLHGDTARGWRRILKRLILARVRCWCAGVLVCGSLGRAYYERYGFGGDRIFYVPYEPDYELIQRLPAHAIASTLESLDLDPSRRRIVFSGRLVPVKRPEIAVQAFQQIARERPQWDLVVVGDGMLRDRLESLVAEDMKARVRFTGFLDSQPRISAIYRASDILVLPSHDEPWGLVVNEAVAAGMAVVCTDVVGAARELVRSGVNGRLVPRSAQLSDWVDALLAVSDNGAIDVYKRESATMLSRWRSDADPVSGFRAAMRSCGLS